jgi:RHS repeat-associated protein
LALVHSGGYHLKVALADGRITALTLAGAGQDGADLPLMSYGYDEHGNLTAVTKPSGATTTFVYDDRRRVTAWIDSNDSRYDYTYDDQDRVVSAGGVAGHFRLTLTYAQPDPETGDRTTVLTTPEGHATRHLIDSRCQVVATTDPLGHTTRYVRDGQGNLRSLTDPLGRTTAYVHDEWGRTTGVLYPDGSEVRLVLDRSGLPTEVRGPDGAHWLQAYDARGNLIAVTDPAGHTVRYEYDAQGRPTAVTDELGAVTHVRCNDAGLPVQVTDPLGACTLMERDALGRVVRITDPVGSVTVLEWTPTGELARRVAPDGSVESWTYDGEGNRLTHTDQVGGVTRFEYTHFDLLTARTHPDGSRYEFAHDDALRLVRVTDALGRHWTYEYDAAGRLVLETDFDGRTLTRRHDAAGQLVARTDALGNTVEYSYDVLGQMTGKTVAGRVTTYEYDRAGRLIGAVAPDSELIRRYDRCGRLKTEVVDGRAVDHAYDAAGRRTRRVTPSGQVTTYRYDAAGRPVQLSAGTHDIAFHHDLAGHETERVFGQALRLSSVWDEAGRLRDQRITASGRTLNSRTYSYRPDGHLTAVRDRLAGARTFDLDLSGRVTQVRAEDWHETYAYDEAGNQTAASWPASHPGQEATGRREYAGTRLTRAGSVHYHHDGLGRVTLRRRTRPSRKADTWHYVWDAENRLTSLTTPDGSRWRYTYDPLGRRTAKQLLGPDSEHVAEQVTFVWDDMTLCEQQTVSPRMPHTVVLTWDHRDVGPVAQTERLVTADAQSEIDRRFFAVVTDIVGSPSELVDEQGRIAWRTRRSLWGTTAWSANGSTYTPLRFPGQYFDTESGLHYNLFRYYEPEVGRYLTPDPLGLGPGPNPLTYVKNPLRWIDPLGLSPLSCRELGLSESAQRAIEKFENIRRDPVGAINSQPNHNHYDAARREANGEVVARKPDGTPFDHIADLKQARNGLDNIRRALEREMEHPAESMTERGLDVLIDKRKQVITELDRLNGFLHSIGHR